MPFKNIDGKEEDAVNQHFPLSPQCFLTLSKTIQNIQVTNAFNSIHSKILVKNNPFPHDKVLDQIKLKAFCRGQM